MERLRTSHFIVTGLRVTFFGLLAFNASCKPRTQTSVTKDLNQGQMMNENDNSLTEMMKDRKVVVIYYANDTYGPRGTDAAFENMNALATLLEDESEKESDKDSQAYLSTLGHRIRKDWDYFRDVATNNINVLTEKLCSKVGSNYFESVGGLVVFRNFSNDDTNYGSTSKYTRKLRWDYCKPGDSFLDSKALEVPRFNEFPYDSQPFAHPIAFQKALESVRTVFDPSEYRYILITKSHGSKENAIVPHLSVDLRDKIKTNPKEIINTLLSAHRSGKGSAEIGLDPFKSDIILGDVDAEFKKEYKVQEEKGISKSDYLKTLNQLGSGGPSNAMLFPIVLMESCKSDLKFSSDSDINWALKYYPGGGYKGFNMTNVGLVYTSDEKGLAYDTINYFELQGFRYNGFNDFQKIFQSFLDAKAKK